MPQFFFHLSDGTSVRDQHGDECADLETAKQQAVASAADLARNKRLPETSGVYVCVTDVQGQEVFRAPLKP
jgi:hypothetical protein